MRAAMNERASSFRGSATCPALRGDERDSSYRWTRSAIRDQQLPDKYAGIAARVRVCSFDDKPVFLPFRSLSQWVARRRGSTVKRDGFSR